jgi:hypothetical protein
MNANTEISCDRMNVCFILACPVEVIRLIALRLPVKYITRLISCCKRLYQILDNESVWMELCILWCPQLVGYQITRKEDFKDWYTVIHCPMCNDERYRDRQCVCDVPLCMYHCNPRCEYCRDEYCHKCLTLCRICYHDICVICTGVHESMCCNMDEYWDSDSELD